MSFFESIQPLPSDPIFGLATQFKEDPNPNKVDLVVGVYRERDLKTYTLKSVQEAEKQLIKTEENKNYLPIAGQKSFIQATQKLVFGEDFWQESKERLFGIQSIGGTGGLSLGGRFLAQEVSKDIYVSDPTWPNHLGIFEACRMEVKRYPYYNQETHSVDYERMVDRFSQLPEKSVVLLHGCCQNPTGCDLTQSQWKELSSLFLKRKLIPFFDFAYQGFGKGLEQDAWGIRHFAEKGHEMLVAASYSKNFGMYGERVGCLSILAKSKQSSQNIGSVVQRLARVLYSNPPRHGAAIITTILQDVSLIEMWKGEVDQMRARIESMRSELVDALTVQFGEDRFAFLKSRQGMFSLLGLEKRQVERMREEYGIYCAGSSRVNLTGLCVENLSYVIEAIVKTSA